MADITKSPRVYADAPMSEGLPLELGDGPLHYLRNVLRIAPGQAIRIFNGRDGEFIARIEKMDKRHLELTIENRIREQAGPRQNIHLLFTPIKKERFDWIIEKAVELGVSELHPVLTQNTDIRKINEDRIQAQIIEAAEQCERMTLPPLHVMENLEAKLKKWDADIPLFAAIERMGIQPLPRNPEGDCGLLVGPSGGFSAEEKEMLVACPFVTPVSLGKNILRTETAVAAGLSLLTL
jgi:16S rRNA (uracil1498-N3)-methyltransferase